MRRSADGGLIRTNVRRPGRTVRVAALLPLLLAGSTGETAAKQLPGTQPKEILSDRPSDQLIALNLQLGRWANRLRIARRKCDAYATRSDAESLTKIGDCFLTGHGRPRSILRARDLFRESARRGSAAGHLKLGLIYRDGTLSTADVAKASRHFLTAAELGNLSAMTEYGLSLPKGNAFQRVACHWYERASRMDDPRGLRLLADCFAAGRGRQRNLKRAQQLYRRSADLGDQTARLKMARHKFVGTGGAVAEREGCDWSHSAAARGNVAAMNALGTCLNAKVSHD